MGGFYRHIPDDERESYSAPGWKKQTLLISKDGKMAVSLGLVTAEGCPFIRQFGNAKRM